jgi:hypothetical protein
MALLRVTPWSCSTAGSSVALGVDHPSVGQGRSPILGERAYKVLSSATWRPPAGRRDDTSNEDSVTVQTEDLWWDGGAFDVPLLATGAMDALCAPARVSRCRAGT